MTETHVPTDAANLALTPRQERLLTMRDDMQPGSKPGAIVPRTFAETEVMCRALAGAGIIPKAYKDRPTDLIVVVMSGAELGIPPMQSLRLYHIIEGVPRLGAEGIRAIILQSPDCEYFEFAESSETRAVWIGKRRGRPEKSITWTIERAKKAGLLSKSNWQNSPEDMLNARASMQLGRLNWPHIVSGLISREEAMDGAIDAEWTEAPKPTFVAPSPVRIASAAEARAAFGGSEVGDVAAALISREERRSAADPNGVTRTIAVPVPAGASVTAGPLAGERRQRGLAGERRQRGRASAEKPPEQPAAPPPTPSQSSGAGASASAAGIGNGSSTQSGGSTESRSWVVKDATTGEVIKEVVLDRWGQAVGQVEAKKATVADDVVAATDANPTRADSVATTSPIASASSEESHTVISSYVDADRLDRAASDFDDDPVDRVPPNDVMQARFEAWLKGCRTQKECVDGLADFKGWLGGLGDLKIDPVKRPEYIANRKLYSERKAKLP